MRQHQLRRRMREPFRERQVLVDIALEHLQKFQVGVARILHIMRQRLQHVAHISRLKIHGTGAASGGEHGHSSLSCNVVLPFVGVGMPVQFANPPRMHRHNRRRDRGGNFELPKIHNAHLAALAALRDRWLRSSESKILRRRAQRTGSHFLILGQWSGNRRLENTSLTPKFLESTSWGVCAIQSLSSTVSYSEKLPSSNTSKNSQPSGFSP